MHAARDDRVVATTFSTPRSNCCSRASPSSPRLHARVGRGGLRRGPRRAGVARRQEPRPPADGRRRRRALLDARDDPRVRRRATGSARRRLVVRRRHAERALSIAEAADLSPETGQGERAQRHELVLAEWNDIRSALDWAEENDAVLGLELGWPSRTSGPPTTRRRARAGSLTWLPDRAPFPCRCEHGSCASRGTTLCWRATPTLGSPGTSRAPRRTGP